MSDLDDSILKIISRINNVEQYGRLYNLLIHNVLRVPYKSKGLRFSYFIVDLLNSILGRYLDFPITIYDIDKSHPLYKKSNGKYVLIVRFVRRDIRDAIFYISRKFLNDPEGITITENLTADDMKLLKAVAM